MSKPYKEMSVLHFVVFWLFMTTVQWTQLLTYWNQYLERWSEITGYRFNVGEGYQDMNVAAGDDHRVRTCLLVHLCPAFQIQSCYCLSFYLQLCVVRVLGYIAASYVRGG